MNNEGSKPALGLGKILPAVLIGVLLILMIGIAVNGWQGDKITDGENSGEGEENDSTNANESDGDTKDENSGTADNISGDGEKKDEAVNSVPRFYNYLTGLECSEDTYRNIPYAFVFEPNAPLYGVSNSELVIEIPIENGKTRYMLFATDTYGLGKIGALSPTRKYISQLVKFFGGIHVAYGEDDIISYDSIPSTLHLDLSAGDEYVYRENGKNIYTDSDKLEVLLKSQGIDKETLATQALPFVFSDTDEEIVGKTVAQKIIIPYADGSETQLTYDSKAQKYQLSKGGRSKIDMLDGSVASFTNAFVLFSDMITYELSEGTQTVVKTGTDGTGYYITRGTLIEIRWVVNDEGALEFRDLNGNILEINRGNSFISYYKASVSDQVSFE